MTAQTKTPSQGAITLAMEIIKLDQPEYLAALIDERLAELIPFLRHGRDCPRDGASAEVYKYLTCDCGLSALLEKWQQKPIEPPKTGA